ncbi:GNAT family N-acetyltransferase [Rhodanobacter sp. MP7CTX1]|uniref:GNAT family N-acetyltransferase n=1 Tax=Rhodanobacter sp. MP7CTX1 TaxID=2723084 RepID=UPI00161D17F7|nr:GNAT family N-acetyltransferase [Rhodanobacter sp. MP7CTX1]MBB6188004.1 GNAT superfamily N-acetyltransferase [Rhodanobacter sp. MP7CTX1]
MPSTEHPINYDSTSTDPFVLEGTHWIESLSDGTRVLIRPLRTEDREREKDFVNRLSPGSRHDRFLGAFKEASPALLDQSIDIDHLYQMAFVALAHDKDKLREVGVSRYSATDDDTHCECAVTVADDWCQRGLGVLLMKHLIGLARRNGYKEMFSIDTAANESMRDLAGDLGFRRQQDPEDSTQVIHTLDL